MKTIKWLFAVWLAGVPLAVSLAQTAEAPLPAAAPDAAANGAATLSGSAREVVKLAGEGTSEEVLMAYVQNSQSAFSLSADNLLYLKDVGLSSQVITAMLNRDTTLRNQAPPPAPAPAPGPTPASAPAPDPGPAPTASAPTAMAATAPPPTYVSNPPPEVNYFYNDLAPYGTWVQLAGYGWCWQPTVVVTSRGWSPYCNGGRWINSEAGWYWASDYSWGWAPFHYGRWYMDSRCGWVWVPGTTWGPAWVTWRTVGDQCGWAPLPPYADFRVGVGWSYRGAAVGVSFGFGLSAAQFTFISYNNFGRHDYAACRLSPVETTRIYNNTTIINNYTVNNNVYVNRGVSVSRVESASHTSFAPVRFHEPPANARQNVALAPAAGGRGEPVIYKPRPLVSAPHTTPMVAQSLDSQHPTVVHNAAWPTRNTSTVSTTSPGSGYGNNRGPTQPGYSPSRNNETIKGTTSSTDHRPAGTTSPFQNPYTGQGTVKGSGTSTPTTSGHAGVPTTSTWSAPDRTTSSNPRYAGPASADYYRQNDVKGATVQGNFGNDPYHTRGGNLGNGYSNPGSSSTGSGSVGKPAEPHSGSQPYSDSGRSSSQSGKGSSGSSSGGNRLKGSEGPK